MVNGNSTFQFSGQTPCGHPCLLSSFLSKSNAYWLQTLSSLPSNSSAEPWSKPPSSLTAPVNSNYTSPCFSQHRQDRSQARLPLPCSVSPFERMSWRGPFPPLLGWSRQQRLCTVPVTLYGYAPFICSKDSCSHLPSLFSLGLLCISLQASGAPLCQVGSPELELLLCGGAQSGPSPLPWQGQELGSTMWAGYFTKTAVPPLLGLEAKMRKILPMSHIW